MIEQPTPSPFEALDHAWAELNLANDWLISVNRSAAKEWSRTGMKVMRERAQALVLALEAVLEATQDA